jgi:hypothetical protein
VENNRYIEIFILWLAQLAKVKALSPADSLHITIDCDTLSHCKKTYASFDYLIKYLPNVVFHIEKAPSTLLEGMMWKFIKHEYLQDIFMYFDIDIYVMKPLHIITDQMHPNKIYLMQEGNLTHPNYNEAFPESIRATLTEYHPAYSAGKFAITSENIRDIIFEQITKRCDYTSNYYCMEQNFFNCILYEISSDFLDIDVFVSPSIIYNGSNYDAKYTVLYDCAGDPANGKMHIAKYMDLIVMGAIGFLGKSAS